MGVKRKIKKLVNYLTSLFEEREEMLEEYPDIEEWKIPSYSLTHVNKEIIKTNHALENLQNDKLPRK